LLDRSLVLTTNPLPRQIWLIGGTQESSILAQSLAAHHLPCLITVTTEAARSLYPISSLLTIWVGKLHKSSLPNFFQAHRITAILDASHPFAVEISQLAIAAATQFGIPYLRFERPLVQAEDRGQRPERKRVGAVASASSAQRLAGKKREETRSQISDISFPTFQALLATDFLSGQRTLLTIGYRPLVLFQPWQEKATLFARILPSIPALEGAIAAGFTPDRLIALRPPVSAALEQALWQQWQISTVVTKASGVAGGEDVKRKIAAEMGIQLVTIARPEMHYPHQTNDVAIALNFCRQNL